MRRDQDCDGQRWGDAEAEAGVDSRKGSGLDRKQGRYQETKSMTRGRTFMIKNGRSE